MLRHRRRCPLPVLASLLLLSVLAGPAAIAANQPLAGVVDVGAGQSFSCALTSAGNVYCWGSNANGNIGNASFANATIAVPVYGLNVNVASLGIGGVHSCAVMRDSSVRCWGSGARGELGNGATVDRHVPVVVTGLSGVVQVVAGNVHSCALTAAGAVKCWGSNSAGQLGDGSFTDRSTPVDVVGLSSGVSMITAGFQHTCALTTAGAVKCWGRNNWGQTGNNDVNNQQFATPVDVIGLGAGVVAVDADVGDTICALLATGAVKCWGLNANGDVGDGTSGTNRRQPVDVVGLSAGVVAITAKCAVLAPSRTLKCWGSNGSGQVGDGTTTARNVPTAVVGFGSDTRKARGVGGNRCGITVAGRLQCWGGNSSGQLGDGTTTNRPTAGDVLVDGDPVYRGGFEAPAVQ